MVKICICFGQFLASDQDKDFVSALQTAIRCIKSPLKYLERVISLLGLVKSYIDPFVSRTFLFLLVLLV